VKESRNCRIAIRKRTGYWIGGRSLALAPFNERLADRRLADDIASAVTFLNGEASPAARTGLNGRRFMIITGSCLCGAVAYEVRGPFAHFVHCHCSRCRKASGASHATNALVAPEAFRWTRGEAELQRFDLPEAASFATGFCRRCGSPMPHLSRSGRALIVPAGTFDADPGEKPSRHVHWSSRAPWTGSPGDLPASE
jgi:hypothetical protein